jgi:ATP-dependent DNA ligase
MPWTPKRNGGILKYKPYDDAEAEIVGFVTGREGKQGNLLGKIGTLLCRTTGPKGEVEFEIGTGMTFEDREIDKRDHFEWACRHPGQRLPDGMQGTRFKTGQTITFKYREFSDDGIPKEGRYFRPRDEE